MGFDSLVMFEANTQINNCPKDFKNGIKLMEQGEEDAQDNYEELREVIPEAGDIIAEENQHEAALLQLLDKERLCYMGSIALGLNDALVELTGTLAGLTWCCKTPS